MGTLDLARLPRRLTLNFSVKWRFRQPTTLKFLLRVRLLSHRWFVASYQSPRHFAASLLADLKYLDLSRLSPFGHSGAHGFCPR